MEEGNHRSDGRLSQCAADVLRQVEPFERRLEAVPHSKDRHNRRQPEEASEEHANRRAIREILHLIARRYVAV
jgi:hypothetical protein